MYTASTVYTSFVVSVLDYCDTVCSCCGSVNTDKLETLQRSAARIVIRLGSSPKFLRLRNSGKKGARAMYGIQLRKQPGSGLKLTNDFLQFAF